jgi:hypothetical protein
LECAGLAALSPNLRRYAAWLFEYIDGDAAAKAVIALKMHRPIAAGQSGARPPHSKGGALQTGRRHGYLRLPPGRK